MGLLLPVVLVVVVVAVVVVVVTMDAVVMVSSGGMEVRSSCPSGGTLSRLLTSDGNSRLSSPSCNRRGLVIKAHPKFTIFFIENTVMFR